VPLSTRRFARSTKSPMAAGIEAASTVLVLRRGDDAWALSQRVSSLLDPVELRAEHVWAYGGELVMCAHHSAMFRFEDGVCNRWAMPGRKPHADSNPDRRRKHIHQRRRRRA